MIFDDLHAKLGNWPGVIDYNSEKFLWEYINTLDPKTRIVEVGSAFGRQTIISSLACKSIGLVDYAIDLNYCDQLWFNRAVDLFRFSYISYGSLENPERDLIIFNQVYLNDWTKLPKANKYLIFGGLPPDASECNVENHFLYNVLIKK